MTQTITRIAVFALAAGLAAACSNAKAKDAPKPTPKAKAMKAHTSAGHSGETASARPPTATKTAMAHVKAPAKTERGFAIHSRASAPESTHEALDFQVKNFGFVSNLGGVMAESPALLNSYYQLQLNLQQIGSLTPPEDNIVQMSIAMENECQYCVAGHTLAGKVFFKSPAAQLEAIRTKANLPEAKFNALREFALHVYEKKGRVSDKQLKTFFAAGYSRKQALDVVANVAAKVMSNYANQLARTPLDPQIKPMAKGLPFAEDRKTIKVN